jgi:hypothetical protein
MMRRKKKIRLREGSQPPFQAQLFLTSQEVERMKMENEDSFYSIGLINQIKGISQIHHRSHSFILSYSFQTLTCRMRE